MTTQDVGIPLKGSLAQVSFPEIVRVLGDTKATGSLYLLDGDTKKIVFFEGGQPVFVRSNVAAECLGQQLARDRLITQEQCDQTLEAIKRTGKKQGELLVEMGILSEGNLRHGLTQQLRRKLIEIFAWVDGRFQFKPGPHGQDFGIRIDATTESVIVSAVLETFNDARARAALADCVGFPRLVAEIDADELGLMDEERHFLRNLDGTRTVAQVLAEGSSPAVPNVPALLYAGIAAGLVTLPTSMSSQPERFAWTPPAELAALDERFAPSWASRSTITEFEDTPLPGVLPQRPIVLGEEDDAIFAEVEDSEVPAPGSMTATPNAALTTAASGPAPSASPRGPAIDEDLLAAEVDSIDDTFDADEEIELLSDDAELDDEAGLDQVNLASPNDDRASTHLETWARPDSEDSGADVVSEIDDDLVLADASGVELLEGEDDLEALQSGHFPDVEEDAGSAGTDDLEGARLYGLAESALAAGDFSEAVELLDRAYEAGFDSAELHAHLAWARWNSDPTAEMGEYALQLLEYAASLEPNLDVVHAYSAAVLSALGDEDGARQAARRALELNPYNDVAHHVVDRLG